jgi:hypothetical protein
MLQVHLLLIFATLITAYLLYMRTMYTPRKMFQLLRFFFVHQTREIKTRFII